MISTLLAKLNENDGPASTFASGLRNRDPQPPGQAVKGTIGFVPQKPVLPPRLALFTWDEGDIGAAGGILKGYTDTYRVWCMLVSPAHRAPDTIAQLLAALQVDHAEQIFRPSVMPNSGASALLRSDGRWQPARGRTLPAWAIHEIDRIAALLRERHGPFLTAAAGALRGNLSRGFRRPDPTFAIQDDTGHTVIAESFPEMNVDVGQCDRLAKGLAEYDVWRLEYRRDRYMSHLSDDQLSQRISDVLANVTRVTDEGLVAPIPPGHALVYWMTRWTEALEEVALRYGPYPSGFTERRIRPVGLPGSFDLRNLGIPNALAATRPHDSVRLVKYGREEHLRRALEYGVFRIASASAYDDRSLNPAMRDNELCAEVGFFAGALPAAVLAARRLPASARIRSRQQLLTNYYVFCTSRALERRLLSDFGGNCCLVIHDVPEFARRLRETVTQELSAWVPHSGDVSYYDPLQTMPAQLQLPFSKHFRYAYQLEHRFTWFPPDRCTQLEPVLVELGDLRSVAEIVVPK